MKKKYLKKSGAFIWLYICLFLIFGCHTSKTNAPHAESTSPEITKIVVVGFRAALPHAEQTDTIMSPLSGSVFIAGPVPQDAVEKITDRLFNRLVAAKKCELVSPGQAQGLYSSIVDSDENVGMRVLKLLQKVGSHFGADAVLAGYIYRWQEREGSDYAVNRAASVAFDLHLVCPADGSIIWRGKFDKTQRSLTENLLDMKTFFQGKGQWMTAEKLALIGLNNLLNEMPICINN
ncbi:MAG TPA: hypothetical protein PK874_00305 [Desulfobacteraceae bacterium]|nr:hypothetical protein [Desulfobacteraceae bacterium]HPJ66857.1 hypothetical protein [Desulfobacteraceae bacterium]HPQ28447.1 hypothetical protein [Desulfobacteraceae bacterium]